MYFFLKKYDLTLLNYLSFYGKLIDQNYIAVSICRIIWANLNIIVIIIW